MNIECLKTYAPAARQAFIAAVSTQAVKLGITAKTLAPATQQGDVLLIEGHPLPASIAPARQTLIDRVQARGFAQTMEAAAYTWFNRLVAIRYMELHGYLDHGYRLLSHPQNASRPEILENAERVDLPGLDRDKVIELKLDGTKDEELYRSLLLAQCNALHQTMPFLFEEIGDETELLLPAHLLHTNSLIRQLVEQVDEPLWHDIEIIGWLYQFYISEKKDQVIGKVVKSEDIPAATQLFTPNWIVKYMVQNSLGAQWLATYPQSPLKGQMEYYIEPAKQTDDVNAQLAAITPSQLNPEELTLIDPASGSGHILVEAYELFKAIYLERGYRQRDVPQLILEKNLLGLDIDERAAQLTGFALMMKGRADDRRLFEREVKLNVMALVDSAGFDAEGLAKGVELSDYELKPEDLTELEHLFEHATTFGSLIQVPEGLAKKLSALKQLSGATSRDLFVSEALRRLKPLVAQAELLAAQYDAVVANPPYMGSKYHISTVKEFAKNYFPDSKSDLFAIAAERFIRLAKPKGFAGLMTPFTWMFIKSYEAMRESFITSKTIRSLIQPEYHAIWSSAAVPICTFVIQNHHVGKYSSAFIKLTDFYGETVQPIKALEAIANEECGWIYRTKPDDFRKIPGSPIAYWVSDTFRNSFDSGESLEQNFETRLGMSTAENDRFVRDWSEMDYFSICFNAENRGIAEESGLRWFPYQKGGAFRKWFGNNSQVVNWKDDGAEIRSFGKETGKIRSHNYNLNHIFRSGITWSDVTSARNAFRYMDKGYLFDGRGSSGFSTGKLADKLILAFLNTELCYQFLRIINPTLTVNVNEIQKLPISSLVIGKSGRLIEVTNNCVSRSRDDWNAYERSWDFQSLPLLTASSDPTPTIESSYTAWITQNRDTIAEMKRLEEENNRLFIDAYSLADELAPDVPIEQITLTVNPAYRYGGKLTEEEQWARFRQDTMEELVSYAIGCMMGRYSLDAPGLIYAHSGNEGFDPSLYSTFPADDDAIVPLTDMDWFEDDAVHRLIEFISVAWDKNHLEANLTFLADNLSPKKNESSRETIRRYLCDRFFKDHLQTYKNRPIYWHFSSGKHKAFQCIVYLHRYNEGTLARMRTEYVIPLQGLIASRIERLDADILAATSTAHRKRLEKEKDKLVKQRAELQKFDEKLRHYADQRIKLDLDDGVKVNYGKFGDLLAEVKKITGEKA